MRCGGCARPASAWRASSRVLTRCLKLPEARSKYLRSGRIIMHSASMRAFLGFVAGAISVLTFHQGMIALLHTLGVSQYAPYRIGSVPPFGVPIIVDLCFWGGLYGLVFGLLM